jgi:hypothetical protein
MTVEPVGTPTLAPPAAAPAALPARDPFRKHPRSEYWDVRTARWERYEDALVTVPAPRQGD